ncbi:MULTISPECIES: aminoglycoside phosphotransferase family protein [Thermocrispum]|jgi:aminoglycoside phosphotransferase (APT) family kinase protein|uniref:Aminoglycoside phosphotransferase family protein n=1 Tax=Thermocrispum agreste TaxID=37925 RepID=A0A2W4J648_9PSEU|nr:MULTISPECIES: aminoglycoside phosphotransferase family protein [Thermocrispum]PZM93678.1 MAG: aminoglycoside phosphotransferase family protein [Thermocrispum agreste]
MQREPRFTPDKLQAALRAVCQRLGVDHHGARLLRFTNNAVYALASIPAVVRIVGSRTLMHRAAKVVRLAEHLERHGVPAVRLYPGVSQPVLGDDPVFTATVWQWVEPAGRSATPVELAELLKRLHAVPLPDIGPWTPLADVQARLQDAEELDPDDRAFLLRECARIERRLAELQFPLGDAVVHGDAHLGNVLVGPDGPVLCDFDSAGIGPRIWDLVPVAVGGQRFGEPAAVHRALADAYGFDVLSWPGYPVLRAVRELKLTTSVLPTLRSNPQVRPELYRRLADLRAGRSQTVWTRYR